MNASRTSQPGIPTPTDPRVAALISACVAASEGDIAGGIAASVEAVARVRGLDVGMVLDGTTVPVDLTVAACLHDDELIGAVGAWLPGFVREALLAAEDRRTGGVHHTSPAMAAAVVSVVESLRPLRSSDIILDPACGGGAFLLAAAETMDGDPSERLKQLRGMDLDPLAVATTVASLRLWADGASVESGAFVCGDGLECATSFRPVDLVIGNPPFLAQLRGTTVRDEGARARIRDRWPDVGGYVDDAAAFLLAASDAIGEGGVAAMVEPASFLAARDAEPVRRRLMNATPVVGIWIDGRQQFEAAVDTVAVILRSGGAPSSVVRALGVPAVPMRPFVDALDSASWAPLLRTDDRPAIGPTRVGERLGDVATVTAGFRDQFYGLRGAVCEDAHPHRLITSGLIDPLHERWGEASCRFDGERWSHPTVDLDAVDPAIRTWLTDRLVPKLMVASQTKTIEVILDSEGTRVPCTPVVTVEPRPGAPTLAHLAAALTSPVVAAQMLDASAGTALSRDAMRVSAATLANVRLPRPGAQWDRAAALVEAGAEVTGGPDLDAIAALMCDAYGLVDGTRLTKWWRERLPRR